MQYQYTPYVWPLLASAFISLSLGLYAMQKRRNVKGAKSFMLSMFLITLWCAGNALEMSSVDFATKLFWANTQYFAYAYHPVVFLILCMQFTGYERWIRNRKVLWFAVIPTIIIILVWTDLLHGLVRYNIHLDQSGLFPVIDKNYGPAFYIHAVHSHLLNILAVIILAKELFERKTVYRRQAVALIISMIIPAISNILYISGLSPVTRFDLTPVFFVPAGIIIAWGIFRYKFLDVIPVARATVIETMDAGVMVLDLQNRVVDINPAFEEIVQSTASIASTRPAEEVCAQIPELLKICSDRKINYSEFSKNVGEMSRVYEIYRSPLTDDKGKLLGSLVFAYDITQKKLSQQEQMEQQRKLAVKEERERHARDLHDNLGQVLSFISFQAEGIRQELVNLKVEDVLPKLDRLVNVAQTAHDEIREYIRNAQSGEFMDKDFVAVLAAEMLCFEGQTGIKVKQDISPVFTGEGLNHVMRNNILNIVKEALNNIRKHAEARNVFISLSLIHEQLYIKVEDDGTGFDMEQHRRETGTRFGLEIMRQRVREIGAHINIKSAPGKGSKIELYVPLTREVDVLDEFDAG